MYQRASAGGGGSDWYNVILLTTAPGAAITITDGDEEVEAVGTGSEQAIAIHNESATYTISVEANGLTKTGTSVTTGTTTGAVFVRDVDFAHVELEFDEEFRGLTGTISDGTTTASYTFPNSGDTDDIYIPTSGTWNVYCTISSDTFKSDDIVVTDPIDPSYTYTSKIYVIPNGKTALPVNNIPLWLACGNIKGKNYTTLAEVLADEDTLRKLLTDDNAIDYLKRSTEWSTDGDLVPILTGYNGSNGSVSATSEQTASNNLAWNAFDGHRVAPSYVQAHWQSDNVSPATIQYAFNSPTLVKRVRLSVFHDTNYLYCKRYRILAKHTGDTNWTELYSSGSTDLPNTYRGIEDIIIPESLRDNYDVYGVELTGSYNYNYVALDYLQFYTNEASIVGSELAMSYIGAYDYAADELLDDSTWRDAIFASEYWEKIASGLIPVMTDNTHPSGEASAKSTYQTNYPYKAFDGVWHDASSYWYYSDSTGDQWLQYEFPKKTSIKNIVINLGSAGGGATTTTFTLDYYDDVNDTWVPIKSFVNVKTNTGAPTYDTYNATCNVSSNKFRLYAPTDPAIIVFEMQVYDHVVGGVQNLLKLAGIDRPYTTIEELLADHEALQKVISSHDAIDYLVTAKSFIDAFTSDATAMRYIGKRNYAANTLLADTNPGLVPIKTQDDASIIYSSNASGHNPYMAFDGNLNNDNWSASDGSVPQYIGYDFGTPTVVKSCRLYELLFSQSGMTCTGRIEASNDGFISDIHDLTGTITWNGMVTSNPKWVDIDLNNDTAYTQYRVYVTDKSLGSGYNVCMSELQFYAKPVTEKRWMEAIRDSEYFESVLNLTVPVLTGPNANATASTENARLGAYAWNAFDGDPSDIGWISADNTSNGWVQYKFPSAVKILCAKGFQRSQSPWSVYANYGYEVTVQGLKTDGGTPVDLKKVSTAVLAQCSTECKINIDIPDDYLAYRMYITRNPSGSDYVVLAGLQFYGRVDVDETKIDVYSAENDSFYEKDASGNIQILGTTSNCVAQVPRSDGSTPGITNGVHTIYSSVAKNPNDLEAATPSDYFKTVKVDDSTIEIMLMPDDALYWWGYKSDNIEGLTTANGWNSNGTGAGTVEPTYNTNNIYVANTGSVLGGFGTKNPVNCTTMHVISKELDTSDPNAGIFILSSKNIHNQVVTPINTIANVRKYYHLSATLGNYYLCQQASSQRSFENYAFWYDGKNKQPTYLSAAYDTLYIMDGARQIPIATTNGEGKSFDALLEPGTYTIYSSVAKDPTDQSLNRAYSREVTITAATQTVKVMPENTLYWYGYESNDLEDCTADNGWTPAPQGFGNIVRGTNSVAFNTNAGTTTSGMSSKTKINNVTAKAIVQGGTANLGTYGSLAMRTIKDLSDAGMSGEYANITSTAIQLLSFNVTIEAYLCMQSGYGRTATCFALWYD